MTHGTLKHLGRTTSFFRTKAARQAEAVLETQRANLVRRPTQARRAATAQPATVREVPPAVQPAAAKYTKPAPLCNSGSIAFEDDIEEAFRDLSGEFGMTRNDTIRFIVREWMEKNTYLPVHELDEDGDVDGIA